MNNCSQFQLMLRKFGIPYRASIIADSEDHDPIDCKGHFLISIAGADIVFDCFGEFSHHNSNMTSIEGIPSPKINAIIGNSVDKFFEFTGAKTDNELGTEFLDDNELPMLVLATENEFKFIDHGKWRPISHQHSGMACSHTNMMIMKLDPTEAGLKLMYEVDRRFSTGFEIIPALDTLIEYRSALQKHGVDCNYSHDKFSEALYPIDATTENIAKLAKDKLPKDLNELVDWDAADEFSKIVGIFGRWKLYILGVNSD